MNHQKKFLLKFLLFFLFVFEGQAIFAQTDTTDQLKFDVGITRNKNRHLWPIIYRDNNEESKDLQLAFSLYQRYEKTDSSLFHTHLLPLYWKTIEPNAVTLKIGTVYYPSLFEYNFDSFQNRKNYRIGSLLPGVDLMNITRSNNGLFIENNAFFFVYSKIDVVRQKSHVVVFPLYWYYKNKRTVSHTLFPIFRFRNSPEKKNLSIYPLFTFYSCRSDSVLNFRGKLKRASTEKTLWAFLFYRNAWNYKIYEEPGIEGTVHQNNRVIARFFPLVFWRKSDEIKNLVVFPCYFRRNDYRDNDFSRTYAGLLYYSKKTPNQSINAFFPLWYVRSNKTGTNLSIITPLFYTGNSYKWKFMALFPLYGKFKSIYYEKEVVTAYTPFIWTTKSETVFTVKLYPFAFYKHDKTSGQNRFVLFPLVFWNRYSNHWNRGKSTNLVLFPFLWIKTQHQEQDNNLRISAVTLFPIFYHKKSAQFTKNILFPIYWHIDNNKRQSHFRSLALIYWHSKSPESQFKMVFPLFAQFKEKGGDTATTITPFIWFTKNKMKSSVNFVPFYFSSVNKNGNFSKFILPLYYHWNDAQERVKLILPFYYSQYDKVFKERITGFMPLYWVRKTDAGEVNRVFFPLVYTSKFGSKSSFTVFPLYWQTKDKNTSSKMLLPVFFYERNLTDTNWVLFPLAGSFRYRQSKTLVLPFYTRNSNYFESSFTQSFGYLYWVQNTPFQTKHVLFPLFYKSSKFDGPSKTEPLRTIFAITPFYWQSNFLKKGTDGWIQKRYLLPFFYSFHSDRKNVRYFPPIYWSKTTLRDTSFVFAPLFFHKKSKYEHGFERRTLLFPLYCRVRTKWVFSNYKNLQKDFKFTAITPFFISYSNRRGEYIQKLDPYTQYQPKVSVTQVNTLFPIFYNQTKYNENDPQLRDKIVGVTPFFWHIKTLYKNHVRFWPLFNYVKDIDNEMHFNILYGLYRYDFDSSIHFKSTAIFWPLIQNEHDNGVHRFHIAPLLWIKNSPNHSYNVLFPLYSWVKKDSTTRMSFLWQVYKYKAIEGRMSGHRFLFRAYLRDRYTNGDFETRFLHKVYVNMQKDSGVEKTIFPFYSKRIKKNGDYYKWVALGLFSKSKSKIPGTKEYYLEEKLLWFIRFRSNAGYLKSKGIQFKKP